VTEVTDYIIICTDIHRESHVYRAAIELGFEAWLPTEPRFPRIPHSRGCREVWGPVLPAKFLAAVPDDKLPLLKVAAHPHVKSVMRGPSGYLRVPAGQVEKFKAEIERENRARVRLHGQARAEKKGRAGAVKKPRPSAKLKRTGRAAEALRAWLSASGAIKLRGD